MDQEPLTTRLRKPFAYQDSDSDSLPSAIDEEEQESLIQNLSLKNSSQNTTFRQLLIAIPVLSTVPFLLPSPLLSLLTRLLAVKSLLATSFLIYALRPEDTGFDALNAWAASQPAQNPRQAATGGRRLGGRGGPPLSSGALGVAWREDSPLMTWLPWLNVGLSSVLVLVGLVARDNSPPFSLACLPAIVYGLALAAKIVMAGVDPESELRALKYDYKGA